MPLNPYFNSYKSKSEQRLVESLVTESIKIMGCEAFYIPMENIEARDLIYGEDPLKKFESAFPIEIYPSNTVEGGSEVEFFSKFGLEIKHNMTVMMSRRAYHERVNDKTTLSRPTEGDLLYIPVLNGFGEIYEIKFVNQTWDMAMTGRRLPFCYELELEKFKYSHEKMDTGVQGIDVTHKRDAYSQDLVLTSVTGKFQIEEVVFQSPDMTTANASAIATISLYDYPTQTLRVNSIIGEFANGVVYGVTSGATGHLGAAPDEHVQTQNRADYDNALINNEVGPYIDNSEQNSFGKL